MDEFADQPPPAVGTADLKEPPKPRVGEDGAPIYDQQFFLALARCGADVWHQWRARNSSDDLESNIWVTFASVDFSAAENSDIDFSGFNFGHRATLSGAKFGEFAKLSGATFGYSANLSGATFGDLANLSGATFGAGANLSGATFGAIADLSGTTFGDSANLSGATFGEGANLSDATFGAKATLKGWSSDEQTKFRTALVEGPLSDVWGNDRKANFAKQTEAGAGHPDRFLSIKFAGARFLGDVDFSDRRFDKIADFSLARFDEPPHFESLINVDLYGAKIEPCTGMDEARRCRHAAAPTQKSRRRCQEPRS